ncbi:FRRS1 reductase, partial [Polypterus senegalus]
MRRCHIDTVSQPDRGFYRSTVSSDVPAACSRPETPPSPWAPYTLTQPFESSVCKASMGSHARPSGDPMAFKSVFLMVFGSALFLEPISSYSNGHVTKSCRSMKPGHKHHTVPPAMPYSLTVDKNIFKEGDQIKVTLSGTTSFEGFLIQARDAADLSSDTIGSFTLVNPAISQRLTCDGTEGSAVSHTSKSGKMKVEIIWNVPASAPSSVQFLFTVVRYYDTFWVKVPGPVITQGNVTYPTQLTSKTVTTEKTATSSSVLKEPFSAQGCGTSKSCLRDPAGCDPKKDTKCFFLSFTKEDTSALFEMSGPAEGYVAFAFSHDKWMGNDDVYICIRDGDYIDISAASDAGRTHPVMASQDHLTDKSWRYSDGIIQCTFKRDIKIILDNDRFPLDSSYFLFFADGQAEHAKSISEDEVKIIQSSHDEAQERFSAAQVLHALASDTNSDAEEPLIIRQ